MRYLSLFSGIGGFEYGIQQSNKTDKLTNCGFSEIDKYAKNIYKKHYPNHTDWGDVTKIRTENLPEFDFLVGGFPCQAFSVAGKRRGFDDTRGTLFFEIARILKDKKPKYFLLENVKGLLSHDKGRTFQTILRTLSELGYDVLWEIFNSKNHGVPQNRERIYIKGFLRERCGQEILSLRETGTEINARQGSNGNLKDEPKINLAVKTPRSHYDVYNPDGIISSLRCRDYKDPKRIIELGNVCEKGRSGKVYSINGVTPTIISSHTNSTKIVEDASLIRLNQKPVGKRDKEENRLYSADRISPTVTSSKANSMKVGISNNKIIKLNDKAQAQAVYSTEGLGVTVNVNGGGQGGKTGLYLLKGDENKPKFYVKNATKKGYLEAHDGDGMVITPRNCRGRVQPQSTPTINATNDVGTLTEEYRIRRLTPVECELLQGFPKNWTKYGADGEKISDTQRYKCCGNAVTTNVIRDIIDTWDMVFD